MNAMRSSLVSVIWSFLAGFAFAACAGPNSSSPRPDLSSPRWNEHKIDCAKGVAEACMGLSFLASAAKDSEAARHYLTNACRLKHADSCLFLGAMWQSGKHGPQNSQEAVRYFSRACALGRADGCSTGGSITYEEQIGTDYLAAAAKLLRKGCEGGDEEGCRNLKFIRNKHGDAVNAARAQRTEACEDGNATACYKLGNMWLTGEGGPEDKKKARELFERACNEVVADACANLGWMLRSGEGGAQDRTAARPLLDKACALGNQIGCFNSAWMLVRGEGGAVDFPKALKLLNEVCENGKRQACAELERVSLLSENTPGRIESRASFESACEAGGVTACYKLGVMHAAEFDGPQDDDKSKYYIALACKQGHEGACEDFAALVGTPGENKSTEAVDNRNRLEFRCKNGHTEACHNLGVMLSDGYGGSPDRERAVQLFDDACSAGIKLACTNFGLHLFGKQEDERALETLELSCVPKNMIGCFNFGAVLDYTSGDSKKALVAFDTACKEGFPPACAAGRALGPPRNDDVAGIAKTKEEAAFSAKLCELLSEGEGCLWAARAYRAVGDTESYNRLRSRAVEILKTSCEQGEKAKCRIIELLLPR